MLLILILLGVGLTEVIGNYFVNYAIARSGAGGDRKISQESTIEVLGEDEKIIENNKKIAKENSEKWSEAIQQKQVEVKANDNITLRGTEYLKQEETNKWAIILHGYRSNPSIAPPRRQGSAQCPTRAFFSLASPEGRGPAGMPAACRQRGHTT